MLCPVDCSHGPVRFTSLVHCQTTIAPSIPSGEISQHGMPTMSTHHATNTAFGGALTTEVTNSHENYPSVIRNTDSHPHLSNVRTTDVQKPATNTLCAKTCAKSHNVRLPAFFFCLLLGPPGLNCWFSSAPVFQWCCSTPQGSPGVGRNTFLSSPHLCFIIVFICDLFVSRDDPLMS